MNLEKLLKYELGREAFYDVLSSFSNWQSNPTPLQIVDLMVNKTSVANKTILVLFNIEFIDYLINIKQIDSSYIYYIADSKLEMLSAVKVFNVKSIYVDKSDGIVGLKNNVKNFNMKFDLVFSNPPYNTDNSSGTDLKIMNAIFEHCDEIIFIHPCTWLFDFESRDKTASNLKSKINNKIKSIEILPVNSFDGIQLPNKLDIIHIDNNYNGPFTMVDVDKKSYVLKSIYDITPIGEHYETAKPFFKSVADHIAKSGSLYDHTIDVNGIPRGSFEYQSEWYCQLADVIGQPDRPENFGFLRKNWNENLGIRKSGLDEQGNIVWEQRNGKEFPQAPIKNSFKFNTETEVRNFINYLRTDFARFCLILTKKNKHLDSGELKHVPWLDYTQEWDDKKLFNFFGINDEIQKVIDDFIPPYYDV